MTKFPTTLSLLTFLIILLHNNLLAYSQVLDINGDPLLPGVNYFILPSARGTIGLSSAGPNRTCPLDVVLQTDITDNALPVTFSSFSPKDTFIRPGVDLNIEFSASTICVISTVWRIQPSISTNQSTRYFVTIGGVKGNPGKGTLNNWFKIESYQGAYVINFCPTVCNTCRPVCGNIGLILENGRTRLGITSDAPLQVSFVNTGL